MVTDNAIRSGGPDTPEFGDDMAPTNEELHDVVQDHEDRLSAVEKRQEAYDSRMDSIMRDIAAVRAEGNARAVSTTHAIDKVGTQITDLTKTIAEHTGAQKRDTEIREDALIEEKRKTEHMKRWATIIGLGLTALGVVCSTLLSWQEVASYIWVHVLHWKEPWANLQ